MNQRRISILAALALSLAAGIALILFQRLVGPHAVIEGALAERS